MTQRLNKLISFLTDHSKLQNYTYEEEDLWAKKHLFDHNFLVMKI